MLTDGQALFAIQSLLSKSEWNVEMLETIAQIVYETGRDIKDV